ncbi:MAG: S26 family signal peptidase [Bdellovibrionales bacterium]
MNDFKEIVVPSGQYFFIGDNLNLTYDSRTYGLVEANDIKGKALYSYFSSHAGQVFWNRIGHKY